MTEGRLFAHFLINCKQNSISAISWYLQHCEYCLPAGVVSASYECSSQYAEPCPQSASREQDNYVQCRCPMQLNLGCTKLRSWFITEVCDPYSTSWDPLWALVLSQPVWHTPQLLARRWSLSLRKHFLYPCPPLSPSQWKLNTNTIVTAGCLTLTIRNVG